MAAVVIRNLPEATHRALKERAKAHGRSTEAEIRDILVDVTKQAEGERKTLGTDLHNLWRETGQWELHVPPRAEPTRIVDFTGPEFGGPNDDDP